MPDTVLDVLKFLFFAIQIVVGLGVLIFLHEFGHFLMAKRNKVRVEIFSLGFGKALWKTRRGDTEYRIAWIPLGGYVKMAGEGIGTGSGKEDELTSKNAWQRLQIFTAGAIMNLIIAFPICVLAFIVGKYEMHPEVGVPGMPETYAGMKPGDTIVEIDGERVASGDHYRIEMVRKKRGTDVKVKVLREDKEIELTIRQSGSESHRTFPTATRLMKLDRDSAFAKAGLQAGDEIVEINGKPMYMGEQLIERLTELVGQEIRVKARRRPEEAYAGAPVEATVTVPAKAVRKFPLDWNLFETVVGAVQKGDPAWEKLAEGDRILRIEGFDRQTVLDGAPASRRAALAERIQESGGRYSLPIRSWQDLKDVVEPSINVALTIVVDRGSFEIRPTYGGTGKGRIGIGPKYTKTFAVVAPDSLYATQGLQSGDTLLSVDGLVGDITIQTILDPTKSQKPKLALEVQRGDQRVPVTLEMPEQQEPDFTALGLANKKGEVQLEFARIYRKRDFGTAVVDGMKEPINIGVLTMQLLGKLLKLEESPKGLAGPLGIFQVSYRSAELSPGNFLWLLALITVNLGIFNLLPIPVLDGGHVVLLAIEKLRGKPPSEKFVAIFQYSGLVFLLALIIFVTYNDIGRIFGSG